MPNNETSWTTVSNKTKTKTITPTNKTSTTNVMPKAEVKSIKLSASTFSAMKDRIDDENDENHSADIKSEKSLTTVEKNSSTKVVNKSNKSTLQTLSLKQALENINVDKLKQLYKSSKDNSSLWIEKVCYWFVEQLKDVTSGLNDPSFSKETNNEFPYDTLSTSIREYFNKIFDTQSKLKAITLCRNCILNPNVDTNRIVGYQILSQCFIRNLDEEPDDSFIKEIDEFSSSLKRYPSDKVLRLLWVYGQLQFEYPSLALNIWFRLMFPLIENRTYKQFVVDNLSQLTTRNANNKKLFQIDELFPLESYLKFIDFIDRPNPALSREMRTTITKSSMILTELFTNNKKNLSQHSNEYFQLLFPFISNHNKQQSSKFQSAIEEMILACFTDKSLIKTWLLLHEKYPRSSLNLLSLINSNEIRIQNLSSGKELKNFIQQLLNISNDLINDDENKNSQHQEFLDAYQKKEKVTVVKNKTQGQSKLKMSSILKLIFILFISYKIYSNWLWLTVAADYLLEDYLKHPTALLIKERLSDIVEEIKKFTTLSLKHGQELTHSTMLTIEPYAVQLGQYLQKQWSLLSKYIEGPIYDKTIEIAEQIQHLSTIIFTKSVHYLNILFDMASYYTADLASLIEVYTKQMYAIVYDKWTNFNLFELREKFDQILTRFMKSD